MNDPKVSGSTETVPFRVPVAAAVNAPLEPIVYGEINVDVPSDETPIASANDKS